MSTVFTIGHGTRSFDELVSVLEDAEIDVLVDVRRFPGSRRHPHFGRDSLEETLPAAGIAYEWWGQAFGGRRKPAPDSPNIAWRVDAFRAYADHMHTAEFQSALRDLEERAAAQQQTIMCAETVWWRCHRRLIADALVANGHEVVHLGLGRDDRHKLHESARRSDDGLLVYDVGVTPPLDV